MLKWFRRQKSAPETIPAQIHPTPKLPTQTNAITERIVEGPTLVPKEEPAQPVEQEKPASPSPISPIRNITTPPEKTDSAPKEDENDDEPIILPKEELESAEKNDVPPPEKKEAEPSQENANAKAALRPVQALMPKAGELKANPKLLYRQLLAGMYDAIIITDPKGHIIETNSRIRDLFLANADSLWDAPISKLIHGITPQLLARLQTNIDKDRHVLLDATCKRADGTTFAAEVAISGVTLMNDGDFVFMIRNVDKRRQTLNKMRLYQNALELSPCPTCIADASGKIVYGNPSLASFLERDAKSLAGSDLTDIFTDPAIATQIASLLGKNEKWEGTTSIKTGEGKSSEAYVSVLPSNLSRNKSIKSLVYVQPM